MKKDVVIIELDRPRELRFGHKALKMIESMCKKPLDKLDLADMDCSTKEKILYCGLKADDEELTMNIVADILDEISVGELMLKLMNAIELAYGINDVKKVMEIDNDGNKKK